jgi:prevent-host-death family protein
MMEEHIVPAAEFQRNFGHYQDEAMKHPLAITRNGRARLVLLSAEEYQRLKQRDRRVFKTEELSESDIAAIASSRMDPRHDYLNDELG